LSSTEILNTHEDKLEAFVAIDSWCFCADSEDNFVFFYPI